ncbi:MAG: hypothetical protein ACJ789_09595 [Thermomicrobiales bacterium]
MTCRDEVLESFRRLSAGDPTATFTPQQIIDDMQKRGSRYAESTVRTHFTARMCGDAPKHHAVTYDDLERVGRGLYRLRRPRA